MSEYRLEGQRAQGQTADLWDEVCRLRGLLMPFAVYAWVIDADVSARHYQGYCPLAVAPSLPPNAPNHPTLGDCRRAAPNHPTLGDCRRAALELKGGQT